MITVAGKAITTKLYGQAIARSYMSGCSKGGHAALLEAQGLTRALPGSPERSYSFRHNLTHQAVYRLLLAEIRLTQARRGSAPRRPVA